ncbi:MAG: carboxypeptidase-like regulatory domain-containing protein [Bacteroidota bacterium]
MRIKILILLFLSPIFAFTQKKQDNRITATFDNAPLEIILDTLSAQTNYFFSYNSEIFPAGSRYTIAVESQPIDQVLSSLLVGTGLKYSFFKDQIILNYELPEEQTIRKKNFFTISGTVLDAEGSNIVGANVFLDGTSIGTHTDSDGNYHLASVPPGYYDLVFSHVGYVNGVYQMTEYNGGSRIQDHQFIPDLKHLEEVEVVSNRITTNNNKDKWNLYYTIFKEELMGRSDFSYACMIKNPEVIHFRYNKASKVLTAHAEEPIIIRNDALGYIIDYYLESFRKREDDLRFRGKIRFRNQEPSSASERKGWRKNRKKSFLGSFNHFKKSLLQDELRKEGFKIFTAENIHNFNLNKSNQIEAKDILICKGDSYELEFQQNLIVEYRKEKESSSFLKSCDFVKSLYRKFINAEGVMIKEPGNQISVIRLLKRPVKLDPTGQIIDKFSMTIHGYMSWERTADLVPQNYDIKWDNF